MVLGVTKKPKACLLPVHFTAYGMSASGGKWSINILVETVGELVQDNPKIKTSVEGRLEIEELKLLADLQEELTNLVNASIEKARAFQWKDCD